ncbi:MAG: MBL fold metallo-hydrolase [Lachnospiraceae bacterium]|nr:MBL fold metallo-hydrolase [Lachnospiraceae bacterium]
MKQIMRKKWGLLFAGALCAALLWAVCTDGGAGYAGPEVGQPCICFLQTQDDADCILIWQGEDAVMIDTGEAADATSILVSMEQLGIEKLDALILTHPDKDHIGGATAVVQEIPVERVFEPYYALENERLDELHELFDRLQLSVEIVEEDFRMELDSFTLTVYPPQEKEYKKDNNYSLAVLFQSGDSYAFFTGDAMKKRQKELLELNLPQTGLLKVPYHGRYVKDEEELIRKMAPEYAVITAAEAAPEVERALDTVGSEVFYSGRENVLFQTDGRNFRLVE